MNVIKICTLLLLSISLVLSMLAIIKFVIYFKGRKMGNMEYVIISVLSCVLVILAILVILELSSKEVNVSKNNTITINGCKSGDEYNYSKISNLVDDISKTVIVMNNEVQQNMDSDTDTIILIGSNVLTENMFSKMKKDANDKVITTPVKIIVIGNLSKNNEDMINKQFDKPKIIIYEEKDFYANHIHVEMNNN